MEIFNKALNEAIANSSVEQKPLNEEEIAIINEALRISKQEQKSFLTSLYELTEQIKNEEQRNKSK